MIIKVGDFIDDILYYMDQASKGEDIEVEINDTKSVFLSMGTSSAARFRNSICTHTCNGEFVVDETPLHDVFQCRICGKKFMKYEVEDLKGGNKDDKESC